MTQPRFATVDDLTAALDQQDYLVDDGLAMALFLAVRLGQPLLLEGEPGVGKTTAAKALAAALGSELIRLQCYEGIAVNEAVYEWNYPRQLLSIRLAEANHEKLAEDDLFDESFLLDRPLLRAVRHIGDTPAVLLIDEIDRADDDFEALLLEFLGERSVTVPEIGTFHASTPPVVIVTSNRSRELHDALKRRCYYHWIEFPDIAAVTRVVRRRVTGASDDLVNAAAIFVSSARQLDLDKPPGLAETIDWVTALSALGLNQLDRTAGLATLGAIAKTPDDIAVISNALLAAEAP